MKFYSLQKCILVLCLLSLLSIIISCKEKKTTIKISKTEELLEESKLFEILNDSISGVSFANKINETQEMNALNYDYMYNGAGLSVADFNNDGFDDIYFVSNQLQNKLYLNKGNLRFKEVTHISKVQGTLGLSLGSTIVDINSDGLLDIYVCKSGPFINEKNRENELFINQGVNEDGIPIFKEQARAYNLNLPHYSTQAAFFDYDKDGDLDMFLINHNTNTKVLYDLDNMLKAKSKYTTERLYQNRNNKFYDVSKEAGLIDNGISFGLGIGIGDLNNDGWPDVLVSQDFVTNDRIYLNNKNGTFTEVSKKSTGHNSNFSMGNDIADFNNDGWLDFITLDMVSEDNYGIKASMSGMNPEKFYASLEKGFHYQYMYNTLQVNNGNYGKNKIPQFSDVAFLSGVSSTDWSWGPLFCDMDNDGDKDLFVSNGIKRDFRNVDFIHYRQRKETKFAEQLKDKPKEIVAILERQLNQDLLRKMPVRKKENYFFENKENLSFSKKNETWGLKKMTASNGAAYADLDNDGDLEIITNNMDEVATIYKNNSVEFGLGNFVKVKLKGSKKNLNGIGARVILTTNQKKQIQEQYFSRGFQSSIGATLHFGLSGANTIESIEVVWPDGKNQKINNVKGNQTIVFNYSEALEKEEESTLANKMFSDITKKLKINHTSFQNTFDDFKRETLLPHKMSEEAIALCVGDINNDGLDDFFVGGAKGYSGVIYIQKTNGAFEKTETNTFYKDKNYEDVDASFFDVDNDGDLDLYVVSGGNEYKEKSEYYLDRLYINTKGVFKKYDNFISKQLSYSGSVVRPCDYDNDGDIDLFVGGRQTPGKYPLPGSSMLLRNDTFNGNIKFSRIKNNVLEKIGMVTDAQWVDIDNDNLKDLILVGEWMPITYFKNDKGVLINKTKELGLENSIGWWFNLTKIDYDNDGDMDFLVGNLGLNSKYQASKQKPFQIYASDFDQTGSLDIVLSYNQNGKNYPLRGRECSSQQMPFIKQKFPNYHSFAMAELEDVYGKEKIDKSLKYKATTFANSVLINDGKGKFKLVPLDNYSQTTSIKSIVTHDFDQDGFIDGLLFGNRYDFEVETPRQDAGYGVYLKNEKKHFKSISSHKSSLLVRGEILRAKKIGLGVKDKHGILILKNKEKLQVLNIN